MVRRAVLISALAAISVFPVQARESCPEGRTFGGDCVKVDLAQAMHRQTFVYTQPKFSYTAPPWLPSRDGEFYVPHDYNEIRKLFGSTSGGGPGCTPPRGSPTC